MKFSTDKAFMVCVNIYLAIAFLIVAYPLLYVVSASFSSPAAVAGGKVLFWPVDPTLMGYEAVFKNSQIITGFKNSFIYMISGTCINLVMTMLCAYPLSRKELVGRNIFSGLYVITMYFSGGLVPSYMLINRLGLLNTRWAMIIPSALSVWNMIICRTYIQNSIPNELYEAATIDGCSPIRYLYAVIFPLSKPILAVLALYYGVGHWNTYFSALIYLKSQDLFPLQLVLRNILVLNNFDPTIMQDFGAMMRQQGLKELLKYAVIVVASVPVLCIYPFVQKYFVQGIMIGSLKG